MPTRIVENEYGRKMLLKLIEGQKLPITVSISTGGKRTVRQNRLNRLWVQEIAEQRGDMTPEEVRGYGQWKGCLFVHVRATAFLMQISPTGHWSIGFELFTPTRWFAFRPFRRLTWGRA